MRFKVDENLHEDVARLLTASGHDAETVIAEGLRGSADIDLAYHFRQENRAFVTLDLDFADIRTFPPKDYPGIVVLRLANQSRASILGAISIMLAVLQSEPLERRLWIVTDSAIRIRE